MDLDKEFYGLPGLIVNDVCEVLPTAEQETKWRQFVGDIEEIYKVMGKGTMADGTPIKVGVGDTGIGKVHLQEGGDLEGAVVKNFTSDRDAFDNHSHGSHVSCMISGKEGNTSGGIVGLAPEAKVYHAKVLSNSGSGTGRGILNGVKWLADSGCKVINLSLGGGGYSAEAARLYKELNEAGILVFCSTGNAGNGRGETGGYPARYNDTASVTAIDFNKRIASFSSQSASASITGVGVNIYSCGAGVAGRAAKYMSMSGTSMSSPFVAGNAVRHIGYFDRLGIKVKDMAHYFELVAPAIEDLGARGRDQLFGRGLIIDSALIKEYGVPGENKPVEPTPEPVPMPEEPCEKFERLFTLPTFTETEYALVKIEKK